LALSHKVVGNTASIYHNDHQESFLLTNRK